MNSVFVWTVGDVIGLSIAALVAFVLIVMSLYVAIHQALCKHHKYYENASCIAICSEFGKTLGFIGNGWTGCTKARIYSAKVPLVVIPA